MRAVFFEANTLEILLDIDLGAIAPNAGDIFECANKGIFRVTQRAFTVEVVNSKIVVVNKPQKQTVTVILQLACMPLEAKVADNAES